MQRLIEAIGGRKAFMSLLTVLLGTVVEFVKPGGLSESYVMLLVGIVGIFSGANALVSWKGMSVGDGAGVPTSESAPAPGDGASQVDELALKTDYLARSLEGMQAEQQVQAEALDKATKLIKAALTIKQA
jgi:hypothetical protein